MKKILVILMLFPAVFFAQDILKDTTYIQGIDGKFYLVNQVIFSDQSEKSNKVLLGDSAQAMQRVVFDAERQVNAIAVHAKEFFNASRFRNKISNAIALHQAAFGKSLFLSTALRDSAQWVGNWRLVLDGAAYDGQIRLNNNQRLIFDPADGRGYTLTQNILLSTFANHVFFTVSGKRYDLYRINEKRLGCLENDSRLIRIE